jgi:hypothetical protein
MTPAGGSWWAAYQADGRAFVVPILCFDESGMPHVWSAETHRPVPAVRTALVGIVSDGYRGEYGDLVAEAIKHATGGHAGDAYPSRTSGQAAASPNELTAKVRDGIEKARDAIHDATEPER